MAEGAQEKRAASMCRSLIACAFFASVLIVVLGSCLNSLGLKYSRTTHKALGNCRREIFILSVPDSKHCCDSAIHSLDWVCVASFDKVNRILSSTWAFMIPLLPFVMTICSSYASECVTQKSSRESHSRRLLLYISIILYRSVSFTDVL